MDELDLRRLEAVGSSLEIPAGRVPARGRTLTDCAVLAVERADVDRLCGEDAAFAERLAASS